MRGSERYELSLAALQDPSPSVSCLQMSFVFPACVWGVGLSHVVAEFPVLAFRDSPGPHAPRAMYWGLVSKFSGVAMPMGILVHPHDLYCTRRRVCADRTPNQTERSFQLLAEGPGAGTLQTLRVPSQQSPQSLVRAVGHLKPRFLDL